MGRWIKLLFVTAAMAVLALTLVGVSPAKVRKVSFTQAVRPGKQATLVVAVTPKARCTIGVFYTTTQSKAKGLNAKRGGKITWRWRVGTSTKPGRFPVKVDCGKAGKKTFRLRVLKR